MRTAVIRVATVLATAMLATATASATAESARRDWAGTWTGAWSESAQQASAPFGPNWSTQGFANQTVRQVIRLDAGGRALRIRLSNVYGSTPLRVAGATIARAGAGASVIHNTLTQVTFGRAKATVVPQGKELTSDPVPLPTEAFEHLAVTMFFAQPTGPASYHNNAVATSYRGAGDLRGAVDGAAFTEASLSRFYLAGVDVLAPQRHAVVTFGDSITDGAFSTNDADNRYPDELAERLRAAGRPVSVLNAGISGNRVLRDSPCFGERATARFQRDVLDQPGVHTVIITEALNDLFDITGIPFGQGCNSPNPDLTASQLIEGHRTLIRAAHASGVRIIGGTVTPFKDNPYGLYSARGEQVRDQLNRWIRESGEYDAVVDFDRVLADPADPDALRPDFDSGDKIHPNDAGYHAMAQAVDLDIL